MARSKKNNVVKNEVVNEVKENEAMKNVNAENVVNEVVNEVVAESEVVKMENVNEVVNEVVNDVENVNEVAPADDTNGVPADDTKQERKERAKINTDPFPVKEIVRDRLSCLLPAIITDLGDIENADKLAEAKLFSIGHDIVIDLVNKLQDKFEEYAPRSYKGKNPSNHWLLWENTRNASLEVKKELESELISLYTVASENVRALVDNTDYYVSRNTRYTIESLLKYYTIMYDGNIKVQIAEITKAGIDTIYVRFMSPETMNLLMVNGFMCIGIENIEAREYNGISRKFPAIQGLYKFKKIQ